MKIIIKDSEKEITALVNDLRERLNDITTVILPNPKLIKNKKLRKGKKKKDGIEIDFSTEKPFCIDSDGTCVIYPKCNLGTLYS